MCRHAFWIRWKISPVCINMNNPSLVIISEWDPLCFQHIVIICVSINSINVFNVNITLIYTGTCLIPMSLYFHLIYFVILMYTFHSFGYSRMFIANFGICFNPEPNPLYKQFLYGKPTICNYIINTTMFAYNNVYTFFNAQIGPTLY